MHWYRTPAREGHQKNQFSKIQLEYLRILEVEFKLSLDHGNKTQLAGLGFRLAYRFVEDAINCLHFLQFV